MRNRQRAKRFRRGAAVVEFAVITPLFFLLLAGIMEFGQAFRIEHTLSNASRRGVRAAIIEGTTASQVQTTVKTHCVQTLGGCVEEGDVTVEVAVNGNASTDVSQAAEGDEISVTVSVPFSKAGVGFYANTFSNSILSSTCTLERE